MNNIQDSAVGSRQKKDFADSTGREQWALSGQALYLHLEAPEEKALDPGRLASYISTKA